MEHTSVSNATPADFTPSFFDRLKRIVANVAVFFDVSAYKKEMARYENELEN